MEKYEVLKYSEAFKRKVCEAYLKGDRTKASIWREYVGHADEHGSLLRWLRQLGYLPESKHERRIFNAMAQEEHSESEDTFETEQLKKRIAQLEAQLKEAEMKALAYSTMVDLAEKEFNLPIRKKYNTKPSKK